MSKAIRFYSRAELLRRLPYSPTTLWRQCKRGNFPKPEKISPGRNGWETEAADAAIAALVTNTNADDDEDEDAADPRPPEKRKAAAEDDEKPP